MITEEMKSAIEKSLPAQTAGVLKERIALIDTLELSLKKLQDEREDLRKELKALRDVGDQQQRIIAQYGCLNKRELELESRERNLDKALLELKVLMLEAGKNDLKDLVSAAFRNPRIMHSEFGSKPVAVHGGGSNMGYVQKRIRWWR